jgi:hypothetical protein
VEEAYQGAYRDRAYQGAWACLEEAYQAASSYQEAWEACRGMEAAYRDQPYQAAWAYRGACQEAFHDRAYRGAWAYQEACQEAYLWDHQGAWACQVEAYQAASSCPVEGAYHGQAYREAWAYRGACHDLQGTCRHQQVLRDP